MTGLAAAFQQPALLPARTEPAGQFDCHWPAGSSAVDVLQQIE